MEKIDLILEKLEKLEALVLSTQVNFKLKDEDRYESEKTDELNAALASASLEFPPIKLNRQNPYLASGYSDLHEVMTKIRPVLGKHGIHVAQRRKFEDGIIILRTRIWHSSGQWIESRVLISPSRNTIEAYGSHLNSMKRFEVMDILGLTVSEDPFDDDGEADMQNTTQVAGKGTKLKELYDKKEESYQTISENEYREIMKVLDLDESIAEDILEKLHIKSFRELPKSRYAPTINRMREIIKINRR